MTCVSTVVWSIRPSPRIEFDRVRNPQSESMDISLYERKVRAFCVDLGWSFIHAFPSLPAPRFSFLISHFSLILISFFSCCFSFVPGRNLPGKLVLFPRESTLHVMHVMCKMRNAIQPHNCILFYTTKEDKIRVISFRERSHGKYDFPSSCVLAAPAKLHVTTPRSRLFNIHAQWSNESARNMRRKLYVNFFFSSWHWSRGHQEISWRRTYPS